MSAITQHTPGLVSVIIPTYNHGKYLLEALESIWSQKYPLVEVVIVDDGSIDNTKEIVAAVTGVKYVYQNNQGLSAARNTGVKNSSGEYFLFLDADDWLLPASIATNVSYLKKDDSLAFVSGAHEKIFVDTGKSEEEAQVISQHHYLHFLQGNYIGMHATVLYRSWIFKEFLYDVNLRACEDYDLYFKITRKFPVLHHTTKIAAYRIHDANMSGNIPMMLHTVLMVLDRQKKMLRTPSEKAAFVNGHKVWKDYYCFLLYERALKKKSLLNKDAMLTLLKYHPKLLIKYILKR